MELHLQKGHSKQRHLKFFVLTRVLFLFVMIVLILGLKILV